ncbi:MAG: hypothetical protein AAF570_20775, partial [Bacteroidota bacterium]
AVDGNLNNPPDSSYFIHQAGVYLKTPAQKEPFYSPLIAAYYDSLDHSYAVVNWGQQAHTEDLQNIPHRSGLLYYTRYRHLGKGMIEVDQMIYNFSQDNMNFLNVPWGGVRNSSLDHFFISDPGQNYTRAPGRYGQTPIIQMANTAGWMAWSNDSLGQSPALAMAQPRTTTTNNSVFRYGDAGNLSNPNVLRDYTVLEVIRFPGAGQLDFGKCMSFRYYYVLGANVDAAKQTILQHNLVGIAMDSAYTPLKSQVDSAHYRFDQIGNTIAPALDTTGTGLLLHLRPYAASYPLFLLTDTAGTQYLHSDPYLLSDDAYDGQTTAMQLLGFRDAPAHVVLEFDSLCKGEAYIFPDSTTQPDIQHNLMHVSHLPAQQPGTDSLVITQLHVRTVDNSLTISPPTLTSNATPATYQWLHCDSNFTPLPGATTPVFTPTQNGTYAVQVTQQSCVDTSACVPVIVIGLDPAAATPLHIFPNPTPSGVTVAFASLQADVFVRVFDARGKLVRVVREVGVQEIWVDWDGGVGVYWVEVLDGEGGRYLGRVV